MNTTKQLVISFALRDLFRINNPELKRRVQETWRHSTEALRCYLNINLLTVVDRQLLPAAAGGP